jgi:glycosyltransferase involved in cell wall biosynthesis
VKVLAVHNRYQKAGGEDVVFELETALLESRGDVVVRYTADNRDVDSYARLSLAVNTIWNRRTYRDVRALIREARPDVMHVHNTLPLISPSVYSAAYAEGVPVVQTLHNFRLMCPGALLFRDGTTCEDCVGTRTRWPAVVHGCYRDSRAATATIAVMLACHTAAGTWRDKVDRYIALSEFARARFIADGWPARKLAVKPNFLGSDPGRGGAREDFALFVGRLSPEKGVATLREAIRRTSACPPVKIAGDGPLMPVSPDDPRVEWLGHQPRDRVLQLMRTAAFGIVPSESYETSPLTVIEAFATGLPVIATRLGTMAEMVTDGVTGLLYAFGDPSDLARKIEWAAAHPAAMAAMAANARREFEAKYTADRSYARLVDIYNEAIDERARHHTGEAQRADREPLAGADPGAGARAGAAAG